MHPLPKADGHARRGSSRPPACRVPGLLILASLGLVGCASDETPAWAVQHGFIEVGQASVSGYQIWEIFERRWRKDQDDKHHLCAIVQTFEGRLVQDLDGCTSCEASYELDIELLESDCAPGIAGTGAYDGVWGYAIGGIPASEAAADPHPGSSLGWYLSWDGQTSEFMGFAWPEALGTPEDQGVRGWVPGERYVLEPAYAWQL